MKMKTFILMALFLFASVLLHAQKMPEMFPFHDKSGLVGYCLADKTTIIKPQFSSATELTEGYYLVSKANYETTTSGKRGSKISGTEKYALLDSQGHYIIGFDNEYEYIGIENGFIIVYRANKMGIINDKNKVIIPIVYESLNPINKSMVIAKKDDKVGIIDLKNKNIVPYIYDQIYSVTKILDKYAAIVNVEEMYGVIDQTGQYIIKMSPLKLWMLTEKSVVFVDNNLYGLCDFNLKPILAAEYSIEPSVKKDGLSFFKGSTAYHFTNDGKLINEEKLQFFEEKIPH